MVGLLFAIEIIAVVGLLTIIGLCIYFANIYVQKDNIDLTKYERDFTYEEGATKFTIHEEKWRDNRGKERKMKIWKNIGKYRKKYRKI